MAAPVTVNACGDFEASLGGQPAGEARLRMQSATRGALVLAGRTWRLTGDPAQRRFRGRADGSTLELKIVDRNTLRGTADGSALELVRQVLRPIPASEMAQSDPGPAGSMKALLDSVPDYGAEVGDTSTFWYAFGPVLYRGRLDGSARVLGIASDPGPTECLPFVRRTLVGDSGQRTQGFLAKLGLTRSYVLVNAFAVALHPDQTAKGRQLLHTSSALKTWRHGFFDRLLAGGALQAVVAFGENAHVAYDLWTAANPAATALPVEKVAHPAAIDRTGSGDDAALKAWARTVTRLRPKVTPDSDGDPDGPNFGAYFTECDYTRIPRRDLMPMAPAFVGDDSWGRWAVPRHTNCCKRPFPDDGVSLWLTPPEGQGATLRYQYKDGALLQTTKSNGHEVATDAFGIPD